MIAQGDKSLPQYEGPIAQLEANANAAGDYSAIAKSLADRPLIALVVEGILSRAVDAAVAARGLVVGKVAKAPFENARKRAARALEVFKNAQAAAAT